VRERSETALGLSEARANLAADAAGADLWEVNIATGRAWATPRARALYGFPSEGLVTFEAVSAAIHPDDRGDWRRRIEKSLHQQQPYSAEYRVVLADGTTRWIDARRRWTTTPPGRDPERLVGVSLDITERKGREERLRQALAEVERLRLQLEKENEFRFVSETRGLDYVAAVRAAAGLPGRYQDTRMGPARPATRCSRMFGQRPRSSRP
jgi:PAS domain S-box-containing protein